MIRARKGLLISLKGLPWQVFFIPKSKQILTLVTFLPRNHTALALSKACNETGHPVRTFVCLLACIFTESISARDVCCFRGGPRFRHGEAGYAQWFPTPNDFCLAHPMSYRPTPSTMLPIRTPPWRPDLNKSLVCDASLPPRAMKF